MYWASRVFPVLEKTPNLKLATGVAAFAELIPLQHVTKIEKAINKDV